MKTGISYACFICVLAQASPSWAQTATLAERFDRIDRDGNGKITAQELPRSEIFRRLDRNGDGFIEKVELPGGIGSPTGQDEQRALTKHLDLAYGDHKQHKLDLYQPDDAKDAPIMVYIHGGGWRRGDKRAVGEKVGFYVGRGWVFVSVNYRLLPEGSHPANVDDVARALAWVHDQATDYGGDREKLLVMGHSAGAHLAALVATSEAPLRKAGKSRAILKGVISLDTNAYDIAKLMDSGAGFYGDVFGDDPDLWRDASPITHIVRDADIPPFLICYSRGMRPLMNPQRPVRANAFAEALRAAGIAAEVVDASDRNHGEINQWFGRADDQKVTGTAVKFLDAILKSKPAVGTDVGGQGSEEHATTASPNPAETSSAFTNLKFTRDFVPGKDRHGKPMGGTECNYVVSHNGKLWAGLSCWKHDTSASPLLGPQVLVKHAADADWELDFCFGPDYGTTKILKLVAFTTDCHGKKLAAPASLLIADATRWRPPYDVGIWTRDDTMGEWTRTVIAPEQPSNSVYTRGFTTEVRMIVDHVDSATGIHHVFACTNQGKIHRGAYDPGVPGRIAWEKEPELDNRLRRTSSGGEANGDLYVSIGMDASDPENGGLFRRIDGREPFWKRVAGWPHHESHRTRNLTSELRFSPIPDPDEKSADILLATQAHPVNSISRIYPDDDFRMALDLDVQDYVSERIPGARVMSIAANGFAPFRHPDTGEQVHIGGLWLYFRDQTDTPDANAAWYLVRNSDGTYRHGQIFDPNNPIPNRGIPGGLRDARTVCASPFPEDKGRVLYFGGFNCGTHHIKEKLVNTAWIYKATLPAAATVQEAKP